MPASAEEEQNKVLESVHVNYLDMQDMLQGVRKLYDLRVICGNVSTTKQNTSLKRLGEKVSNNASMLSFKFNLNNLQHSHPKLRNIHAAIRVMVGMMVHVRQNAQQLKSLAKTLIAPYVRDHILKVLV